MITCGRCGHTQPDESFNWRNKTEGVRHTTCKLCTKVVRKTWYEGHKDTHIASVKYFEAIRVQRAKDFVNNLKESNPCSDCKVFYPHYVMDFDHLRDKEAAICTMVLNGLPLERLQTEIDKCEIVCSNCHRARTHMRRITPVSELPPKQ